MVRSFLIVFGLLTFGNTQKLDHLFEQFERGEIEAVKEKLPVLIKKYPNTRCKSKDLGKAHMRNIYNDFKRQ